jgi:hypothetical protein
MGLLVCFLMKLGRGSSLDLHAVDALTWLTFELRQFVLEPTVRSKMLPYGEAC